MKGQSSATIPFIFPFLLLFSSTVYCLAPFCASIDPPIKDIPDLKYTPIPLPKHSQQILNDFLECLAVKFQTAIKTKNGSQEGTKAAVAIFSCQFLGRADKLLQLMNESFPELGLQQKDCFEMSWEESMIFLAGCPVGTPLEVLLSRPKLPVIFFKSKSDYVKKPIPKHGWKSLWKNLITIDHLLVQLNPYGGRMSEISESGTPFPHRAGNLFSVQYFISWKEEEIETIKRNIHMSRKLYKSMAPYVSQNPREALQNYRDLDIGANLHNRTNFRTARRYGSKYFKGNFDRLVRVKTMVRIQQGEVGKNIQAIGVMKLKILISMAFLMTQLISSESFDV
ncbi:unnamed protein product [Malus baccata var. baccata]